MLFTILFFLLSSLPLWGMYSSEDATIPSVEASADRPHGQRASLIVRPLMRLPQESFEHREAAALCANYPGYFKGVRAINWQGLAELKMGITTLGYLFLIIR